MENKKKCGALPKFPNIETSKLRIDRVVPKELQKDLKNKTNQFIDSYLINQLQTQALDKCVAENLKKDGKDNI